MAGRTYKVGETLKCDLCFLDVWQYHAQEASTIQKAMSYPEDIYIYIYIYLFIYDFFV